MTTPRLDARKLLRFEQQLKAHGVPFEECSWSGVPGQQAQAAIDALGIRLPDEALVWWHWRNGTIHGQRIRLPSPWAESMSVEAAVRCYRVWRGVAVTSASDWPQNDPDYLWHPSWLPLLEIEQVIAIDCSVAQSDPVPVMFVDWQNLDGFYKPRAQSIGQMVDWWTIALELGAWHWNDTEQRWQTNYKLLPPPLSTSPLL